jgi:hypothetical protein
VDTDDAARSDGQAGAAGVIDAATRGPPEEFFETGDTVVTSVSLVAAAARNPT